MPFAEPNVRDAFVQLPPYHFRQITGLMMPGPRARDQSVCEASGTDSISELVILATAQCRIEPAQRFEILTADREVPAQQIKAGIPVPELLNWRGHPLPPASNRDA